MTSGLNEVETSMDAVVHNFGPIDTVLLLQIRVEARLDIFNDGLPAKKRETRKRVGNEGEYRATQKIDADLSSLLTKSPKPGVSTTVK